MFEKGERAYPKRGVHGRVWKKMSATLADVARIAACTREFVNHA